MKCPRCQHENRPQATFCEACGTPLTANPSGPPAPSYAAITSALTESLEQQTATGEILRVIASSPTDVQPVFEAVLKSAARLCDAIDATIFLVDGDGLRLVAHEGPIPSHPVGAFPLIPGLTVGRAVLDGRTIHVPDVQAEVDEYPEATANARSFGSRSTLSVPLLRGTKAIGVIGIRRTEVRPFTDRQIELLETFASQAVIAIENVRLFTETKEALEQQTATSEILRVISSSPTAVDPVFDAILDSAVRLCESETGLLWLHDGEAFRLVADRGAPSKFVELRRARYRPGSHSGPARAVAERRPVHIVDMLADPAYAERDRGRLQTIEQLGARTGLWVPMLTASGRGSAGSERVRRRLLGGDKGAGRRPHCPGGLGVLRSPTSACGAGGPESPADDVRAAGVRAGGWLHGV